MKRVPTRLCRSGQSLVEFAAVLPIFLLLLFGTIELGWLVYTNHTLTNATREGARYAMVHGERSGDLATVGSVQPVVAEFGNGIIGTINTTRVDFVPDAQRGSNVTVETAYEYQPLFAMIVGMEPFTLTREATVIVQY